MDNFSTDDDRQNAIRAYLEQTNGVPTDTPSQLYAMGEPQTGQMPVAPMSPASRDQAIKAHLEAQYAQASDDSAVKAARQAAGRQDLIANLGAAFEGLAKAKSQAYGGPGVDTGFYTGIKQQAQAGIDQAEAARQKKMAAFNQQYTLERQVAGDALARAEAQGDLDRKNKASEYLASQQDPTSEVSERARKTIKSIYKDYPAISGVDLSGMSAAELADFSKNADLLAKLETAKEIKNQASEDRKQALAANTDAKFTPAQKAVDQTFGKDYADYKAAGGYATVEKQLQALDTAIDTLKSNPGLSGGLESRLPDSVRSATNPQAVALKENVQGVSQSALRQVLGAQFTEKEGKMIMDRAFNPALPAEENIRRIEATKKDLLQRAREKEAAANYYEDNGTLKGYKAGRIEDVASHGSDAAPDTQTAQATQMSAPHGARVRQNGVEYEWNGSGYIPTTQMAGGQ